MYKSGVCHQFICLRLDELQCGYLTIVGFDFVCGGGGGFMEVFGSLFACFGDFVLVWVGQITFGSF